MKNKRLTLASITLLTFIFSGCENPADKTADASVTDSVEPAAESVVDTRYRFADSSTIGFVGSKVTGSHDGSFKQFDGYFTVDPQQQVTGGVISIDMSSTVSDNEKLTGHLKSEDFFHVENYPDTVFTVTGVRKDSETNYQISGNLKMRGVEKNVTFPAIVSKSGDTIQIDAEFDINRQDWNIVYAGKADDLIRDEVVLKLNLTASPSA